jgi:hypothetical protein
MGLAATSSWVAGLISLPLALFGRDSVNSFQLK